MEPDGSTPTAQSFTSGPYLCHLNPIHICINCLHETILTLYFISFLDLLSDQYLPTKTEWYMYLLYIL
jgi:hypothetical protein